MSKWQAKPTQKERGYAVLITFIITLAAIIFLYVMSLTSSVFMPLPLLLGVAFMLFLPGACYIGVSRYRQNVYTVPGVSFCILIMVMIIAGAVGYYFSRL